MEKHCHLRLPAAPSWHSLLTSYQRSDWWAQPVHWINGGHTLPKPYGIKMKDNNQNMMLQNRFLLVYFSNEYLWTLSSTWGILQRAAEERRLRSFGAVGSEVSRRGCEAMSGGGMVPRLRPLKGIRGACSEVVTVSVALTISWHLATTKLKWPGTSVSHDVLDSYRKQDRTKQEHSCGTRLKITTSANIRGCIPLWA